MASPSYWTTYRTKKLEAQRKLFERMVSPAASSNSTPNSLQLRQNAWTSPSCSRRARLHHLQRIAEPEQPSFDPQPLPWPPWRRRSFCTKAQLTSSWARDQACSNAPIPQADHTLARSNRACHSRGGENLYKELPREGALASAGTITATRAGTHRTNAGSNHRHHDSVNTAKRLQENSARNQIIITKCLYDR